MSQGKPRISESDPRWQAMLARDPAADRDFVYAVRTTGVYCRPSSASRLPRIENVEFFATPAQAEAAGYRASKRRASDRTHLAEQHRTQVTRACQLIESAESAPSLNQLAEQLDMSPFHFHRVFKAVTGVTPKAYASAHRAGKVRKHLHQASTITDALYEAGFNSNSRFYESSNARLGMTPGAFRDGGANTDIRFAIGQCSLGAILVAQSERGICAILLGDDPQALLQDLQDKFPKANLLGGDATFETLVARVVGLIESPGIGLDLPLDLRGTAFQERVWQALRTIPAGTTASYAEIAQLIGAPKAVRAVAQACAANSLAVAIPCHRVVRSDGNLSGYRWGVERKRQLLEREAP
ncbi:bifunctional DNA-binding transcriptional regulator/O6-methylguanine-DNA methyltransferase Ada [Pseudomonas sp. GD03860]|uniref:bifunctional DNA-binding transcriptional regulator/O6-methylguanine-DNA methyltransferase Ada n=1 Tax=Pseudomonas TaxID=286 RepID=UPI002363B67C|nr:MULTISPECIES: bifunctional DNA-binding transcriptional regulator/O6-methylguanine-DNA methyltransferase Ada [Pseudomonas]MDD2060922.1 bifunctional DNA-binding transcriptional regulator/O6-methylguanine-DNA methyltransferase Ada [Pseudomonas putida]MDH0638405.1 bifunctional DNA-binding transcriptional regulator/O6-methylguanine-DNA methyltransferase Ada [Pseudomonas sp. GD03860]